MSCTTRRHPNKCTKMAYTNNRYHNNNMPIINICKKMVHTNSRHHNNHMPINNICSKIAHINKWHKPINRCNKKRHKPINRCNNKWHKPINRYTNKIPIRKFGICPKKNFRSTELANEIKRKKKNICT